MCKVPLRFCSVFEKQGNSLEPAIYNLYLLKPISTPLNSEAAVSLHPNAMDQGTPQRGPILSAICETIPGQSQKASTMGYHTILYHDTSPDTESPALVHHNTKHFPCTVPRPPPGRCLLDRSSLFHFPQGTAQRRTLLIPSLQLQLLKEQNAAWLSSVLFLSAAKKPSSLPAPAHRPSSSAGSPAPRFIWRAPAALLNVSQRRQRP